MEGETLATVLIVDDIPDNIDVLRRILRDEYRVKAAISGKAALQLVNNEPPDIILLDIMMPEMDGYQVCRELKANPATRHIPVIFVSAKNEVEDETIGFDCGAVDYITKPVRAPLVRRRVSSHIKLYDQRRHLQEEVKARTADLEKSHLELVDRLGRAAEYKDNETGMHVKRMSVYSKLIALELGYSQEDATQLQHAAPMHDIGKIGIPDGVLLKPGKLDAQQWEVMKTHAQIGYEILKGSQSEVLIWAAEIAISHHEKFDGSGYPNGLVGEEIPLNARIVMVADVFDALTSSRPYKKAWSEEDAIKLINDSAGSHFDPKVVEAFNTCLPEILEIKHAYND